MMMVSSNRSTRSTRSLRSTRSTKSRKDPNTSPKPISKRINRRSSNDSSNSSSSDNNNNNSANKISGIETYLKELDEKGHDAYRKGFMVEALSFYRDRAEMAATAVKNIKRKAKRRNSLEDDSMKRELAASYKSIGLIMHDMGDKAGSLNELERALEMQNSILDQEDLMFGSAKRKSSDEMSNFLLDVANTHVNIAQVYVVLDKLQNALDHLDIAHKQQQDAASMINSNSSRTLNINNTKTDQQQAVSNKQVQLILARTLAFIGEVFSRVKNYKMALDYHLEACEIRQKHCPNTLTHSCSASNVGLILYKMGKFETAYCYLHDVTLQIEKKLIPDTYDLADSYSNVGEVLFRLERFDEAVANFEESLRIKQVLEEKHAQAVIASQSTELPKLTMGSNHDSAAPMENNNTKYNGLNMSKTHGDIGWLYHRMGRHEDAQKHFYAAIQIEEQLIPNSNHLAQTYFMLITSLQADTNNASNVGMITVYQDKMNSILYK